MAHPIPTSEPAALRAGDTWTWSRNDLTDYPASTWSLTYRLRNADGFIDIAAAADGDAFLVSVPAATTAAYSAGIFHWYAFVSDGTDRHQVDDGTIEVLGDVSAAAAFDGRTLTERLLDAVNAALEARADAQQLDLIQSAIGDRSKSRDPAFLHQYRSRLIVEVQRESGSGGLKRIVARFPA